MADAKIADGAATGAPPSMADDDERVFRGRRGASAALGRGGELTGGPASGPVSIAGGPRAKCI
eukprot:scaffold5868_cov120-Isochrysis_galbana.AAC.3